MKFKKLVISIMVSVLMVTNFSILAFALNGDTDADGIYTTKDAQAVLLFSAKINSPTKEDIEKNDVNRDGYLTTEDALMILKAASGIEEIEQHVFTPWAVTKKADCYHQGEETCSCLDCGKIFKKVLPKTDHKFVGRTCESEGTCIYCGDKIEPLGHKYENGVCVRCHKGAPEILYNGKTVYFGYNEDELKNILGEPDEILKNEKGNENVSAYVYIGDYKSLGIFTFTDSKLTEVYSNSKSTKIIEDKSIYSLSSNIKLGFKRVNIISYEDSFSNNKAYAFSASTGKIYFANNENGNPVGEKITFHVTNGIRAINNLKPLIYSKKMHETAIEHSLDMGKRGYFDHYTPEGLSPFDRMKNAGVIYHYAAENIASGYDLRSPYILCNLWYNSEGHRANMLNINLTHLGVGTAVIEGSPQSCYSTQNFYTPFS